MLPFKVLLSLTNILSDTENNRQVFYCAAETEVLKSFVSLFGELNIEVVGITTEAISSFAGLKKNKDNIIASECKVSK